MASATEEQNFHFFLILIHLNVNCHMWLLVTILHNTGIDNVCAKVGKVNGIWILDRELLQS